MRKPRSKVTSLRFSEDFYARVKEHADEDEHSVNELIVRVLSAWMDGRRYEPLARPLDDAAKARAAAASARYKRPRGRPMTGNDAARDDWLLGQIARLLGTAAEGTIAELVRIIAPDGHGANFDKGLERNLVLAGWQQLIRTSDGALVWLGPDHPAIATIGG